MTAVGGMKMSHKERPAYKRAMGWSDAMATAYTTGLRDAADGRPSNHEAHEFEACYIQGYKHGTFQRERGDFKVETR